MSAQGTDPVLVLRHDTGRKVVVDATDLRWWSVDVSNVSFVASRGERKTGDLPFLRKTSNAKFCVRVTLLEGFPEPEGSRGGWGEEEARRVLDRLATAAEPRPCSCAVPACAVCHYQSLIECLEVEAKERQDTLDDCRREYELAQAEGRDGWSEALRSAEGLLANTLNQLKWAGQDLREAREDRG